ncbi:N-acetylmuramic acid 6-phosphate etherase [Litorilituus sediminis]|uniref:N-acetylmuramic acid 6-phosphate etherase n=1 Tax=Litorilituus sediminis TaxID=718192 RepID=A0A4P6P0C6_9GAMM|nr:N-acetylmuramic acid 6-phosphate etherase [Litorilituus sediminis]QBG34293.1 N-acetylmuramic acid 6-phosphate etherase [Litorilituus sediminis]
MTASSTSSTSSINAIAKEKALLSDLATMVSEGQNPATLAIDTLPTTEVLTLINQQDKLVAGAVEKAIPNISLAVDAIVEAFKAGGRLIYVGAGTSGRLGVLDAVECPPTFSVSDDMVIGLIAGGEKAMYKAVEGAEDSASLAIEELQAIHFNEKDILVGIAASGRTPYVISAIDYANSLSATTVSVTCNPGAPILANANIGICAEVGPEALTGSTRMKSGTAQKLILNMLTTASMIRRGKSYTNLMVDVHASNEKLYARASRIVMQATQCTHEQAREALQAANYSAKLAILMILTNVDVETAKTLIDNNDGFLRAAVDEYKK